MKKELEVLADNPDDVYLLKGISAHTHTIFFSPDLKSIPKILKEIEEGEGEPLEFMIQRAIDHYGTVLKYYYHCDSIYHCYQQSLSEEFMDKAQENSLSGVVKRDHLTFDVASNIMDKKFPFEIVKKYVEFCGRNLEYNSLGFDFFLEEKTDRIYCFDCNISVTFSHIAPPQVTRVYDRYFNARYAEKMNKISGKEEFKEIGNLKIMRNGDHDCFKLELKGPGKIKGEFAVRNFNGGKFGSFNGVLKNKIGDDWELGAKFRKDDLQFDVEELEEYFTTRILVFESEGKKLMVAGSLSVIEEFEGDLVLMDDEDLCVFFDYVDYECKLMIE